jgi:hypothetical protein
MENDREQADQDQDIQIVDIANTDSNAANNAGSSFLAQPGLPPPSPRRKRQLPLTALIVILALLIIIVSTSGIRNAVIGIVRQEIPTPTPTLAPGADLFYVQAAPPWGHLSIDGHLVPHLPTILTNPPLHFSAGHHVLQWQAAPFFTQRCILSVPPDFSIDTCIDNDAVQLKNGFSAYVVTFTVSLNILPAQQRTSLINAAQNALNSQQSNSIVRPGEYYASYAPNCLPSEIATQFSQFTGCIASAKQPLKATMNFQLDTNENTNQSCATPEPQPICSFSQQSCHLFCPIGDSTSTWGVGAAVNALWTFTTLNGKVVERNVPDDSSEEDVVALQITWSGTTWHVIPQLYNAGSAPGFGYPVCQPVQYNINLLSNAGPILNNSQVSFQWSYFADSALTDGCVAIAQPVIGFTTTPTPTTSSAHTAYCLFRFGVILAANPLAHQYYPYLPLADAYEQNLAKRMAASSS